MFPENYQSIEKVESTGYYDIGNYRTLIIKK